MANQSTLKKPAIRKAVQAAVKAQAKTQPSPTKAGNAQEGGLYRKPNSEEGNCVAPETTQRPSQGKAGNLPPIPQKEARQMNCKLKVLAAKGEKRASSTMSMSWSQWFPTKRLPKQMWRKTMVLRMKKKAGGLQKSLQNGKG